MYLARPIREGPIEDVPEVKLAAPVGARAAGQPPESGLTNTGEASVTLTPDDPELPHAPKRSWARRALRRAGIAAAIGATAMVTTTAWPVLAAPLAIFIAAATLAVDVLPPDDDD
jgi:hypothetical protein